MTQPLTDLDTRFSDREAVATEWEETRRTLEEAELFWISTVTPAKALAFAKGTFGQTRHRFPSGMSATTRRR